ncbi:hypothetical protein BH09VER1_BH09VER1_25070 [soil metagenome]
MSKDLSQNNSPSEPIHPLDVGGLVAFWDFQEEVGREFVSQGEVRYRLIERDGEVPRVAEGVFGKGGVRLGEGPWLCCPRSECPALNFRGPGVAFTVVAWIKRERAGNKGCEAVAGLWNEHGLRQYCLFLNLRIHDSAEQVGAHVSGTGGASPGEKYCMEAAIGATEIGFNEWHCVAMSYDGARAYAWLDGRLDVREKWNPFSYKAGIFDTGPGGADFTVGAVQRPDWVDEDRRPHGAVTANFYGGLLGGLAVFERAVSAEEMVGLARWART